ncbi:MAG TPA: helix-turn-helix domain-containing protein [Pseudolabrys sp.]|jgi:DNA-binding HxlR family transcriptional regulator
MAEGSYNQFCPVAMAAEIICTRWTPLLLRELTVGTTRFNDLRRGVPRMSPALLSKRLKDLEAAGIVTRSKATDEPSVFEYRLTESGRDLKPIIDAVGAWGQRWIDTEASLENLDVNLLMWSIRRNINPDPMPRHRTTVQVIFTDLPKTQRNWWLIAAPHDGVDLCSVDPGFDVDLYLSTDLRTMTEMFMGYISIAKTKQEGRLTITGNRQLEGNMKSWFGINRFAKFEKRVA